jgi:hypothetical protein
VCTLQRTHHASVSSARDITGRRRVEGARFIHRGLRVQGSVFTAPHYHPRTSQWSLYVPPASQNRGHNTHSVISTFISELRRGSVRRQITVCCAAVVPGPQTSRSARPDNSEEGYRPSDTGCVTVDALGWLEAVASDRGRGTLLF